MALVVGNQQGMCLLLFLLGVTVATQAEVLLYADCHS